MPQVILVSTDHNSGHYTSVRTFHIRERLNTRLGLLEACSLAAYNTKYENVGSLGGGTQQRVIDDAARFVSNETETVWTWCDLQQQRSLVITEV
jgi:ABC-type proline/glycine betaine transport system ATPase subunit